MGVVFAFLREDGIPLLRGKGLFFGQPNKTDKFGFFFFFSFLATLPALITNKGLFNKGIEPGVDIFKIFLKTNKHEILF